MKLSSWVWINYRMQFIKKEQLVHLFLCYYNIKSTLNTMCCNKGNKSISQESESEVTCGQVWWPIHGISALHLTHLSAHTHREHTHTVNTHPEQWAANAAAPREQLGVWCLAQGSHLSHGIEGGESAGHSLPPTYNPCRLRDSNPRPSGYKSNSLSIRPRLPQDGALHGFACHPFAGAMLIFSVSSICICIKLNKPVVKLWRCGE